MGTFWKQVGFPTPHYMRGELIYFEKRDFQRENLLNIFWGAFLLISEERQTHSPEADALENSCSEKFCNIHWKKLEF